jgi:hypothetical protein
LKAADAVRSRLRNQLLGSQRPGDVVDVVRAMGAVQAQDFNGAKWALAQRLKSPVTSADIDRAFDAGSILRTHVLRPTWHFVAPEDIRWMLALSRPRQLVALGSFFRRIGLSDATVRRSLDVIAKALQGGKHLARAELARALAAARIRSKEPQAVTHLIMHAEFHGVICSGARRGKQHTYALVDERVPAASTLPTDVALAELARRYFCSRGPATIEDFAWWSGLTMREARIALGMVASSLESERSGEQTLWFSPADIPGRAGRLQLLPPYDEYLVSYADRRLAVDAAVVTPRGSRTNILDYATIVRGGRVVGTWGRGSGSDGHTLVTERFATLDALDEAALDRQTGRLKAFLGS